MARGKKIREKNEDNTVKNENQDAEILEETLETTETESEATATEETTVEDKVKALETELEALNDKYLRLNAEYQNYRKRVEKEKADIYRFGSEKLITDMLPIMDNFERALTAAESLEADEKITSGIQMIKKSLEALFDKNGVKKIDALGTAFDPEKHHAVLSEDRDDVESEHVIEVLQDGYALNEKVIRPSMVKVSS